MIYDVVSRLAKKKGLSIRKLEMKAGLKPGVICHWKKYYPRYQNLKKVADALGVSVNTLRREEEKPAG